MKAEIKNNERTKEQIATVIYRLLEHLDGERMLKIIPYPVAQRWKVKTLEFIERKEVLF